MSADTLQPVADRLLVRPEPESEMTRSGRIVIPEKAREGRLDLTRALVLAVGPGNISPMGVLVPTQIRVGDTVLFAAGQSVTITVGEEKLAIVNESSVLAKVAPEAGEYVGAPV